MNRWQVLATRALNEYHTLGLKALDALHDLDKAALSRLLLRRTLAFQSYCRIESLASASGYDIVLLDDIRDLWLKIDQTNIAFDSHYGDCGQLAS